MSRKTLLFIIIIAVVAFIAIGIVAALDNPEYYREKIQATAETETGFEIEINGELNWRYWPPIAISIEDVDVRPAGSDVPLATLKSAAVDLQLLPLLFGTGDIAIDMAGVVETTQLDKGKLTPSKHELSNCSYI